MEFEECAIASSKVEWDSVPVGKEHVPARWGELRGEVLALKDTQKSSYSNKLVAPNRFHYMLPLRGRTDWEEDLLDAIRRGIGAREVHLFSTPASRNEFYGVWILYSLERKEGHQILTLYRLKHQDPSLGYEHGGATEFRSRNEEWHGQVLSSLFPTHILRHEPESILDLHRLSVERGVQREFSKTSQTYTIDFVLSSNCGLRRLYVESKPSHEFVTDESLFKCRDLRDRNACRVVFMIGSRGEGEEKIRYLDLGPPGLRVETWIPTLTGIGV